MHYKPKREQFYTYICAIISIVFSAIIDFPIFEYVAFLLCFGAAICFGFSVYFWTGYAFETKLTIAEKIIFALVSVVLGFSFYYLELYKINALIYILVFAILVSFVKELYDTIRRDNLTKLYNRYGLDVELREQLRQYEKDNKDSFYIISCDLDNFKHINDTWGHKEGDRALILIAGVLSKVAANFNSEVFRIGGDEFIIITDKSEEGLAEEVTKAIKDEVDKIDFRDDFDIKISLGTTLYDGVTPISELLDNADKKMYEAKRKG